MAGIGFELRRMIDEREGFVNKMRAYACAGLISSGPWLMTILTLTLLNIAGPALGGKTGYSLFRALVTYSFAFSLVLQGIVQMAVTRRIADLLYGHRYDSVLPAFAAMLAVIGVSHAAIALAFSWYAGFDPTMTALTMSLFSIIGMTWMALIWLSVVRQYDDVLRAYIYGTLISLLGIPLLFLGQGTSGILAAYTAGQAFTLVLLVRTIVRGMETGGGRDFTVVTAVISFPLLVGVGFLYNAAIWADKMIFWFADGKNPHPLVYYHPLYDTCSFLAYLTVVPALAVNLIRLETSFYEKYRAYYGAILGGTPLSVIEEKKERMFQTLRESIVRLLRVQGALTVAVILFAPMIINFLELPPIAVRIFRLTCLGAYFHVLLLITILMQMYFDLQRQAFATSLLFCLLNTGLAWWSVERGVETYGIGYCMASFLGLLLGYMLLHGSLERLDYLSFTNQPIGEKEEQLGAAATEEEETDEEAEEAEEAEEESSTQPAAAEIEAEAPNEPPIEPDVEVTTETIDVPVPAEEEVEDENHGDVETATLPAPLGLDAVAREIVDDDGDDDIGDEAPATATEFDNFFEEAGETAEAPPQPEHVVIVPDHQEPEPFADDDVETRTRALDAAPDHDSFVPAFGIPAADTATETVRKSVPPPAADETQADGALGLDAPSPDGREGKDAEGGEPDGSA